MNKINKSTIHDLLALIYERNRLRSRLRYLNDEHKFLIEAISSNKAEVVKIKSELSRVSSIKKIASILNVSQQTVRNYERQLTRS